MGRSHMWVSYSHWGFVNVPLSEPVPACGYICWTGYF